MKKFVRLGIHIFLQWLAVNLLDSVPMVHAQTQSSLAPNCSTVENQKKLGVQLKRRNFLSFSRSMSELWDDTMKKDIQVLIQMANIEEKQESHNQVVVYHGQKLYIWLLQLFVKEFKNPGSLSLTETEWLPLRFTDQRQDIDAQDLKQILHQAQSDWSRNFIPMGLSVHVNLVSSIKTESALSAFINWDGYRGLSHFKFQNILSSISELYTEAVRNEIHKRLEAIIRFIGWRMRWQFEST